MTDVGNGTYTTTALSTTIGTCTFTATINSGNVGGGTSVQVIFVVGNTINVTANTNWSALTGGTGTGGIASAADKIIVSSSKTLTVDTSSAVANTVTLGNSSTSGTLVFNSGSQLILGTLNTSSSGTITMTSGGILVITNSIASTGLSLTSGSGSINFGGAGSQTLPSNIGTYHNLATVGTVNLTTGCAITVSGTLSVGANSTFSIGNTNTWTLGVTGASSVYGTLTLANTGTKTFTGDVTISSGGAWNETGNALVNLAGNLTNNGTLTANSGTHTFSGATKTISGTSGISIPTATFTGAYTNSGTLTVGTLLTITGVTLTNNGTITANTALSGTGGLTQGASGILNIGGTSGITTITATAAGNTVNYNGGAAQTVKVITYSNLTLSGSGIKTIGTATNGTLTTGTFSIDPSGTATASITNKNIGVYTLVITGSTKAVGTWGYGPANPPANRDTSHFANTTGYVTSSH